MDQAHHDSLTERYRELSDDIAAAVAVVSATRGKAMHAITVDSFLDVSYDPPTMAVSIYSGSRMMETLETSSHRSEERRVGKAYTPRSTRYDEKMKMKSK